MLETIRDFFSTVYLEKNHNPAFDTEFITFHGQCLKFESDTNQIKSQKKKSDIIRLSKREFSIIGHGTLKYPLKAITNAILSQY